jgi:hypothetical protein
LAPGLSRDEFLQVGQAVHSIGFQGTALVVAFWPSAGYACGFFVNVVALAPAIIFVEIEVRSGLGFSVVNLIVGARAGIVFKLGHFGFQG